MAKLGRKTKRSPEVEEKILSALRVGHIDKDACTMAGIAECTFYEWMKIPEFSELVERSRLASLDASIKIVRNEALTNWKAAAWWLSRRGGKEFKQESELPPINVNINNEVLTPEIQQSIDQAISYALPKNRKNGRKGIAKADQE